MEIAVREEAHLYEIWLTRAEAADPELRERLRPLLRAWSAKRYLAVVYASGEGDLAQLTSDLLCYNRIRLGTRENAAD